MTRTFSATETAQRGDLLDPVDFVNGKLTHEYNAMTADIARGPRRTLWQRFTIRLAGQK